MPVTTLYVEGKLDAELLVDFLGGMPLVEAAKCSKNALAPRVRTVRDGGNVGAYYLRDRDFDHLPPEDLMNPTVEQDAKGNLLGWRWARHELENYMLEPQLVESSLAESRTSYESALLNAAIEIRTYQAARWTIGQARMRLPPVVKFNTHPDEKKSGQFYLPQNLDRASQKEWVERHSIEFLGRITPSLSETAISTAYADHVNRFTDEFLGSLQNILVWFSGKDLMKAIEPWLLYTPAKTPGGLRQHMRDWMKTHVDEVLESLPEWRALLATVRQ